MLAESGSHKTELSELTIIQLCNLILCSVIRAV